MEKHDTQAAKARQFTALHHGQMLVLPNIWDPLGALLLQQAGFQAVATASASVAFSHGCDDGEKLPFDQVLPALTAIVESVNLPVTADIESGYASSSAQFSENIRKILGTGVAGINLEDSDKQTHALMPVDEQCERIRLVRKIANDAGVPLCINARTDIWLRGGEGMTAEEKLTESLSRANAYQRAGANCFFPIGIKTTEDISRTVSSLSLPVNILAMAGVPELKTLKKLGVARVSFGPGLLRVAIHAMQDAIIRLHSMTGLDEITGNPVTMDFLRKLVGGNPGP